MFLIKTAVGFMHSIKTGIPEEERTIEIVPATIRILSPNVI